MTAPRSVAQEALARIEAHEEVCAERMKRIDETLAGIKATLEGHEKIAWSLVGALGLLAIGLIGFLFMAVYGPHTVPPGGLNAVQLLQRP